MNTAAAPHRSRVPWALALAVGLASGLAGYVIRVAQDRRIPKQVVRVQRLTDIAGSEEMPAISPDGKTVAFVADRRQIWIQPLQGIRRLILELDHGDLAQPRWSADSQALIYFSEGAIWEIAAAGGEARRLVDAAGPGDLSHDGKRLAFTRFGKSAVELTVCLRDGSDSHTVTALGTDYYTNLRWSPDDNKIALLEGSDIHAGVLVVSVGGGTPLSAGESISWPDGVAWTPDNSGLIVSAHGELWFIPRKENAMPSQLTFGELSYRAPDVSPTGELVVSRDALYTSGESDIVMFTSLKW